MMQKKKKTKRQEVRKSEFILIKLTTYNLYRHFLKNPPSVQFLTASYYMAEKVTAGAFYKMVKSVL